MGCISPPCFLLCFIAAFLLAPAVHCADAPQELYDCINRDFDGYAGTVFQDLVEAKPTRLRLKKAWWSNSDPIVSFTVVTALTLSRMDQLQAQCDSWPGPLSAAVYVAMYNPPDQKELTAENQKILNDGVALLAEFHAKNEDSKTCQLDLMFVYEVVGEEMMTAMLPINTIRNYALLQARTDLLSMIDVDLLISKTLFRDMLDANTFEYYKTECAKKKLFVLPAFETAYSANFSAAYDLAWQACQNDKTGVLRLCDKGLIFQFALPIFFTGHGATNYKQWFNSVQPYKIDYRSMYEPWFILDRHHNPLYDVRFRGYGWNKVTHVAACNASGFDFMVYPNAFIVHRQHTRSSAAKSYFKTKKDPKIKKSLFGAVERMKDEVFGSMDNGTYVPLVDIGVRNCISTLSWWKKPTAGGGDA